MTTPLLSVSDLSVWFPMRRQLGQERKFLRAVDGVSFEVGPGETLGLVGESGSGKSTTGRAILSLEKPESGSIKLNGREVTGLSAKELAALRREMQLIFQDPYASINPRLRVGDAVAEPLRILADLSGDALRTRVRELFEQVGLDPSAVRRYPHELSGGMRQRVGIARALALNPAFIVCDEPTSALDVSVQAQILNLLSDLRDEFSLAYLFISHDLAAVRQISHRVAVMYAGQIVEVAGVDELFDQPLHPYAGALLSAVPVTDPEVEENRQRIILGGEVADPVDPPTGCRFHPRCPFATDVCATSEPLLTETNDGRWVSCHHWEKIADDGDLQSLV